MVLKKIEKLCVKELHQTAICHNMQNLLKMEDLNIKTETINCIEENIGAKFMDLGIRDNFMNLIPKAKCKIKLMGL